MKKTVVMLSVLLCSLVASSSLASTRNKATFEFKSDGSIYVHTLDCENPGPSLRHPRPNKRATKIKHVNHQVDEVEQISTQFLRINGKLYDAYVAEFQRKKIDKTHNVSNNINEKEFRVTDKEENYFTDGKNYYYHKGYPTFNTCFFRSRKQKSSSITLSEFQLNSPKEEKFYLSQKNHIFTSEDYSGYTPFVELDGKLYFKSKSGKYVLVPQANPKTLRELGETYSGHFFTDGQHIIFQGEILDFNLHTFKQIRAGQMYTRYFEIEGNIYYFHMPSDTRYHDASLTKTNIDAETFEAIDTTGSYSGILYQDNDYVYKLKYKATKFEDVVKIARKY